MQLTNTMNIIKVCHKYHIMMVYNRPKRFSKL